MLEQILKLYVMAMAGDVRSPLPHLVGPPGCGKSTSVEQAAELLGVNLHVINVSRISPLELEGVQMPHTKDEQMKLKLLTATFWTQLKEGDILLLDEFLRAFPEVYNGLLDILTSRQVGGFKLPKVFIIAASNSTTAYDKALEDRLLHLPVPDPRKRKTAKKRLAELIVNDLGLLPTMVDSYEMGSLLDQEVLPMFDVLDSFKSGQPAPTVLKGHSVRNLIGQAKLRQVSSSSLQELLRMNNERACSTGKEQFVLLWNAKSAPTGYESEARKLRGNSKLTEIQALNLELNLQLLELERTRNKKETEDDDDESIFFDDDQPF